MDQSGSTHRSTWVRKHGSTQIDTGQHGSTWANMGHHGSPWVNKHGSTQTDMGQRGVTQVNTGQHGSSSANIMPSHGTVLVGQPQVLGRGGRGSDTAVMSSQGDE